MIRVFKENLNPTWIDVIWAALTLSLLLSYWGIYKSGRLCSQMGVDFRGYYASGQIALRHGFSQVYNQELQKEFQDALVYRCSSPSETPSLNVGMPYLPVYVLIFLPFTLIDFTASYFIWVFLQLSFFIFYLFRIIKSFGGKVNLYRTFQWGLCIPLFSNLYLGQINTVLVIFLCEFVQAYANARKSISGLWLSALLLKPHTLILMLPGLILHKNWLTLLWFGFGALTIFGVSFAMIGVQGFVAFFRLVIGFAGPLIQTVEGMVNWRALALNFQMVFPSIIAYLVATVGWIITLLLVLRYWINFRDRSTTSRVNLVALTFIGTFLISWHSHFYMLMLIVPLLFFLESKRELSKYQRIIWLLGPPIIYLVIHLLFPTIERNLFGMGMLLLMLFLFFSLMNKVPKHGMT